ncbi:MAG: hypothetical protein AAB434_00880 [Planctomycetota bacterium]
MDYAVGGAIALAQWGVARGTKDADLNLWMDPARPMAVAELLGQLGCQLNASAMARAFQDKGLAYVFLHGVRVDIYLPTREFHESVKARRRRRPLLGRDAWFLSAEDLAVFKMIIYRDKDLLDVRGIVAVQGMALDRSYVREWLPRLVGAFDVRLKAWEEMVESAEEALRKKDEGWKPPFAEGCEQQEPPRE